MEAPSIVTSGFFKTELESALKENGFALMSWEVHDGDDAGKGEQAHAEASVELLPEEEKQGDKGAIVEIQLTLRGYQVQSEHKDERYHETLDDLLNAVSPAYVQRRQKLLFAKLEDVAKERSWNEQDEKQEAGFKAASRLYRPFKENDSPAYHKPGHPQSTHRRQSGLNAFRFGVDARLWQMQ